jgi:hypothetical protein
MDRDEREPGQPHRWAPGESGNPAGRPRGARNKHAEAAETMLLGEAERLTGVAVRKALEGDMAALRLCLNRVAPPARRTVTFALPPIETVHDLVPAHRAIMEAAAEGVLTADEAKNLAEVLDSHRRAFETGEMEQRIAAVEHELGLVEA